MVFWKIKQKSNNKDLLNEAILHHQHGELLKAEKLYRKILNIQPENPDALNLFGVLLSQTDKHESAIKLINDAIKINPAVPDYYNNLGTVYFYLHQYENAIIACKQALQLNPEYTDAYFNLGNAYFQTGQFDNALVAYEKALSLNSTHIGAQYNKGNSLIELGRLEEAVKSFEKTIQIDPEYLEAHFNLANSLYELGKLDDAIVVCEKLLELNPDSVTALNTLGQIYKCQNNLDLAIKTFEYALHIEPESTDVLNNYGSALFLLQRYKEAIIACESSIKINPDCAEAYNNLGSILDAQGKYIEAKTACEKAISLNSNLAEAQNNLGIILQHMDLMVDAENAFQKALELNPDFSEAYNNLGHLYQLSNEFTKALNAFEKALALNPDSAETYNNLGFVFQNTGKNSRAIENYKRALSLKPDFYQAHSNLLLCLAYNHEIHPEEFYKEHIKWDKQHSLYRQEFATNHSNKPDPDRKLKVGYVSPDFRYHSVAYFIESIFSEYNRNAFEVIVYSNTVKPDGMTDRLKGLVNHWNNIVGMSDEQIAEQIREDAIDILVDLAGHTAGNKLRVFTLKPAPIQITYLGYPNTTGIAAIDYRLTDALADPPGKTEHFYTEKLIHLPDGFLCYKPPEDCPEIKSLPAMKTGQVTFGCFNNPAKLNPQIISIWSSLLRNMSDSRLILKAAHLNDEKVQKFFINIFNQYGIDSKQVIFNGLIPSSFDHMDLYNSVDIALDTFPYNGTTTTCEALWMGVPVVTLAGNVHPSCVGRSILNNTGLSQLIANSPEGFIEIGTDLARNTGMLAEIREGLRDKMSQSPITQARPFTDNLEKVYRELWISWCHKNK